MTIKFDNQFPAWNWIRQTPNSKGYWKGTTFIINDDTIKECDYYVVLGGLNNPVSIKVKYATIFIAVENQDLQIYEQNFLDQFDIILTHRRDIKHRHIINSVFPAYWFVGRTQNNEVTLNWSKGYDELMHLDCSKSKTKLISVIASNKRMIEGHNKRLFFVEKLKEHFGNKIDVFGRGINEIDDKWNAIAPYKYHVVLENSFFVDEVSEKLHDAFLGQAYPFYCGASNIYDYFPKNSLTCLDINSPEKAIQMIEECIKADTFENSIQTVKDAKQLTLNYYNLFDYLYRHITAITEKTKSKQKKVIIQTEAYCINNKKNNITLKQILRNILRQIPILGNIWYYRNKGLEYEFLQKEAAVQKTMQQETYLKSNDYIQYTRCKPWFEVQGDKNLNLHCDNITASSVVFDFGGYEGQWTSDIFAKYLCNVFIFEPYKEYANNITQRFANNDKIKVFDFGLANETFTAKLSSSDNSSSMFITNAENFVEIQLVKAVEFLKENNITQIDLVKMNIEGGEYDLLEHLIDTGFIKNIKNIKVQFHDFIIENAKERMNNIQEKLSITHKLIYQYEFVWEHWELK